jgi:crotonobetaine/carnitine-CoA ligase
MTSAPIADWRSNPNDETVIELLRSCVAEVGDRPFLDFGGDVHTYQDLWDLAASYASGLAELGVAEDQTVVTMLDNKVDAVALWFATNMLGAIWVPINTALKGSFLAHVLSDAGARVTVCEPDFVARVEREIDTLPALEHLVVREAVPKSAGVIETLPLDALRGQPFSNVPDRRTNDTAMIIYTGGTTGPSKGCVISNGYVFSSARGFLVQSGRTSDELNWSPLPIYHFNLVSGTVLGTMLLRGTAAVAPRFSVSGFWLEMERTGAKMVNLLGSMGALVAQAPDSDEMVRCRGQVRIVHGAPFPPPLQQTWRERFGVELVGGNTYGLTEAFPLTTLALGLPTPPGSSGRANVDDFDVRLFDDDDREVPVGEVGEVVCRPRRPDAMFKGYWRRPEAVAAVTRNLWFHTGDLGRFDAGGYFYFVDRKKDYLRRRGENVSSQEMEVAIVRHPAISEVAVHAVPSEVTEDDVKVTAVLAEGSALTAVELFEWMKDRVPYFALPRYIEFRDALPVSPLGRVHKYQLRDEGCTATTWDRELSDVEWERR